MRCVPPLGDFALIVTCEECSTSFQLDEARIPPEGARVRCSRCKHAFFLPNPSTSAGEAVHAIAADAASGAAASPAPTSDLGQPDPASIAVDPSAASQPGLESPPEPEEEDWQFNAEIPIGGEEESQPAVAEEADFGEGFDADAFASESREVGLGDLEEPGFPPDDQGAEPDPELSISGLELDVSGVLGGEAEPAVEESGLGPVDEFDSLMAESGLEAEPETAASEPEQPEAVVESALPPSHASSAASDDLGDPESWDLIGSDAGAASTGSIAGVVGSFGGGSSHASLAMTPDFLDSFESSPYHDESAGPSAFSQLATRVASWVGWAITLTMIAGVLYASFQREQARWSEADQSLRVGSYLAETTGSGWIETSRAGNLLVVRGEARNEGAQPLWPKALQLALLDGAGDRLTAAAPLAGSPLEESVLREASPEALEEARSAAVGRFMGTPLAAGEVRPFEVVVGELPTRAERLLLELGEWNPEGSPGAAVGAGQREGQAAAESL